MLRNAAVTLSNYSPQQLLLYRINADLLTVFAHALEFNLTINQSEQGIIRALANVLTRVDMCAALTDKNVAAKYELAVRTLCAETFCLRITTVLCRTYALFMSEKLNVYFKHLLTPPYMILRFSGYCFASSRICSSSPFSTTWHSAMRDWGT